MLYFWITVALDSSLKSLGVEECEWGMIGIWYLKKKLSSASNGGNLSTRAPGCFLNIEAQICLITGFTSYSV